MALVDLAHVLLQLFADSPGSKDQQLVVGGQAARHAFDETMEMLEAMRFAGGLCPPAAAAMADGRVMPNMSRRMAVGGHFRLDALNPGCAGPPVDDDRLLGIDPYDAHRPRDRVPARGRWLGHDRAQAGRLLLSSARSAYLTAVARSQAARSTRTLSW